MPSVVARLPPALVDWSGAANYLATTDRHVRELVARGEIAVVKVGRLVRFHRDDLDEFIASNRREART